MAEGMDTTTDLTSVHIPKIISARKHGTVDYCHAAFFLGMALVCRKKNPPAAAAALSTGLFVLTQSLLTDYPLGVAKVISFETHGWMDASFAAASWFMPDIFGFKGTKAAAIFRANTFLESTAVALTDFNNQRARDGQEAIDVETPHA